MGTFIRFSNSIVHSLRRTLSTNLSENLVEKSLPLAHKSRKTHRFNKIIESDLMINHKFKNNEAFGKMHWSAIREELIKSCGLTDINVDSQIYEICIYYKNFNEAKNYFKFLEENNYTINLNLIGSYLKTFYLQNEKITNEDEKEIFRIYDNLRKQYKLLDSKTCNDCIAALSITKRWKEAFELLKMQKMLNVHNPQTVNCLISTAFNHNEAEVGWSLMHQIVSNTFIEGSVYLSYLTFCMRQFKGDELQRKIEEMFCFWREYNMLIMEPVVIKYADAFKLFGYSYFYTTVSNKGQCHSCKYSMKPFTLSSNDFQTLSQSIFKNVIIGTNVHINTSPEELKRYMLFVETMKPYDVVIDGLNVAYAAGKNSHKDKNGSLKNILDIINYFIPQKKRVLVIGRVHMDWWSKSVMQQIREKADVFLMKNISKDDQFLLYITLVSGAKTYFVSRDLMRQHKSKLESKNIQILFKRWQMSRQYKYEKSLPNETLKLVPPISFDPAVQKHENGWHIPFTTNNFITPDDYEIPEKWICLRKTIESTNCK